MQANLTLSTSGRGFSNITQQINQIASEADCQMGLCHVFIKHTSASLILCENADPDVLIDLENHMQRLVQDAHPEFLHTAEGPDDMSAHIRTVLTSHSLSLPISEGRLNLGTWQGIFLWEHRLHGFSRELVVTVISS